MALSLLNYFFWDISEATAPFMLADSVVLVALHYIERGMKAERKVREIEAQQVKQHKESDKAAVRAQQMATRAQTQQQNYSSSNNKNNNSGGKKVHNIQQPSKRD